MQLRAQVEVEEQSEHATVRDRGTGLQLVVSHEVAGFLTQLRSPRASALAQDLSESLLAFFRGLGMLDDATLEAARTQQARYILDDAEHAEQPRIVATVERAAQHTALHREHLATALARPGGFQLAQLPLLDKSLLRRHFPRGLTVDTLDLASALRRGDLLLASTSGSTGERLQVYSDTRVPRLPEGFASLWGLTDLPTDRPLRTAVLSSPGCSAGICTRRGAAMAERIAFQHTLFLEAPHDPFTLRDAQVVQMTEEMERFAPDLWLVNPVFLQCFSERAMRLALPLPRVSAIVTSYQYAPEAQQRRFARHFACPVFPMYAATELGGSQIAIGCRLGALHVRLDHSFVELVRDGVRVAPGELGNPVVTTHHPSMPLVRYRLTDLARFALAPCACEVGSAWPTLTLEGRERDAFVCGETLVTSAMVDRALEELPCSLYQLHESRPGRLRLAYIAEQVTRAELQATRERLLTLLSPVSLELVQVSRLGIEESGKFRYTLPFVESRHA